MAKRSTLLSSMSINSGTVRYQDTCVSHGFLKNTFQIQNTVIIEVIIITITRQGHLKDFVQTQGQAQDRTMATQGHLKDKKRQTRT